MRNGQHRMRIPSFSLCIVALVAGLLLAGGDATPAAAFSICPGDPWFIERVNLELPPLPDALTIRVAPSQATSTCASHRPRIEIQNTGDARLDVLGPAPAAPFVGIPVIRPVAAFPDLVAYHHIWSDGVDTRRPRSCRAGSCIAFTDGWAVLGVDPADPFGDGYPRRAAPAIVPDPITGLTVATPYQDGRPLDIALPAPDHGLLQLAHQGTLIQVPIRVSFALNPDYDPARHATSERQFGEGLLLLALVPVLIPALALVVVIGIAIGYAVQDLRHPRNQQERQATRNADH
jgi:hypothetical protein